jgi:hypothetical protein
VKENGLTGITALRSDFVPHFSRIRTHPFWNGAFSLTAPNIFEFNDLGIFFIGEKMLPFSP